MSRTTLLAGGVGGARLARGLAAALPSEELTIIVNTGDDERIYGLHVAADLDTVTYTLAGTEGPQGWGLADDTWAVMDALEHLGADTSFRLGDRDLGVCLYRTTALDSGLPLSDVTREITRQLGIEQRVLPVTDDPVPTRIQIDTGEWLPFQEYFVTREHRDEVRAIEYSGTDLAEPAPGVIDAIDACALLVIAPSNPPLSIQPMLAIGAVHDAVARHERVVAVSPLFGGTALKGPADRVLASLGFPPGNAGIASAYDGIITDLVIDTADAGDAGELGESIDVHVTDTRFPDLQSATRFAEWLLNLP